MNLSTVAWILAGAHALAGMFLLTRTPDSLGSVRGLARNVPLGVILMLAGTGWFVSNLYRSDLTDFAEWRPIMYAGFTLLGIGCCFFVRDYLPVRGGTVVALLVCDRVLDIQRWHPSPAKNVVTVWAYLVVGLSVWLAMSPWRFRDALEWVTGSPGRLRGVGVGLIGFGGVLAALAALAYR